MNSKHLASLTTVLALIAVFVCTRELLGERAARSSADELQRECDALAATVSVAARRTRSVEQRVSALESSLTAARAARPAAVTPRNAEPPAASSPRSGGGPPRESIIAGQEFMARHPAVKQAVHDLYRAQTAGQFGSVFRSLGFSSEQIERFEQGMMQGAGVTRIVPTADGRTAVLSVSSWDDEKRRADQPQLMALLGPDGVKQVREAVASLPARRLVAQLAGSLYATPDPLTSDQAGQLTRLIVASGGGGQAAGQTNWSGMLTHAQTILSPAQLGVLGGLQAEDDYQQALRLATRRDIRSPRK